MAVWILIFFLISSRFNVGDLQDPNELCGSITASLTSLIECRFPRSIWVIVQVITVRFVCLMLLFSLVFG